MQKTRYKHLLSFILCIVLIAAMALFTNGCNAKTKPTEPRETQMAIDKNGNSSASDTISIGEGSKSFLFSVTDVDGNESFFTVHTDKTMVGEALFDYQLIDGDEGPYGLYIKTVNGITLDFDTDGKYWAFYVNGEYAVSGVDLTEITEGSTYSFKAE